jgi:hypothetical protein
MLSLPLSLRQAETFCAGVSHCNCTAYIYSIINIIYLYIYVTVVHCSSVSIC